MFIDSKYGNAKVIRFKFYMLILLLFTSVSTVAQMRYTANPSEYQVKASFLYNFARFIQWPDDRFSDENSPIRILIAGNDPFGIDIDKTVEGKRVNGRRIEIRRSQEINTLEFCHILFIKPDKKEEMVKILESVKNESILTVGETEGFLQAGGILNFIIRDNRVRFIINPEAASRSRIWVSAQLLKLASMNGISI